MSLKHYLILGWFTGFLLGAMPSETMAAPPFSLFQGQRTAWYFNQVDGRVVIGLQGPFLDQFSCRQQAQLEKKQACYQRETVAFFRWRQNQQKMWVLPVRTGEQSQHLVFANRKDCHRVAESGFYFTITEGGAVKVRQRPDLQTCIVTLVYFDEIANRYAFVKQHPLPEKPYPQRYQAWSMLVETGHYRKLLQFKQKQHCEQVAQEGKYYNFLPRAGFGKMRITYRIPAELRTCVRRASQRNEIPVIYQHIREHRKIAASPKPQRFSGKSQSVWVLTIQKPGGAYSLFFEKKRACLRVQQHRFYYREINRGKIFPSTSLKTDFDSFQGCTQMELPADVQERFYPFADKH